MSRRLFLGFCLLAALVGCDTRARVIVDNQSECGTIRARLTNTETGEVLDERGAVGVRHEFIVQPDVFYEYIIDFTAAGTTPDNFRCTAVEEGKVRVPAGTSQTFTLRSERQTAAPTAEAPR